MAKLSFLPPENIRLDDSHELEVPHEPTQMVNDVCVGVMHWSFLNKVWFECFNTFNEKLLFQFNEKKIISNLRQDHLQFLKNHGNAPVSETDFPHNVVCPHGVTGILSCICGTISFITSSFSIKPSILVRESTFFKFNRICSKLVSGIC